MRVRVLGGLVVEGVPERELGSRKARTLLKALALARGRPVAVDRLADLLWGDEQPARPSEQVGVLVSRLRRVLGAERLPRRDAGYALHADWLDLDELAALVASASDALAGGRVAAARVAAEAALALARGPVLPEEDGDWVEADRAASARAVAAAGVVAAEAALLAGDPAAAVVAAGAALARDPVDEAALRALMRAHVASGRPASALAAYAEVRARLAEDLGVSPTAATEALHDEIVLAGTIPTVPPPASTATLIVGRDRELAAIAAGGAGLVLVVGEAGIGKSALVRAAAEAFAARGGTVLAGRCDELGRDLPLQPVVDAVAIAGGARTADLTAALAALAAGGDGATRVTDGEAGRARLFDELLAAVEGAGDGGPVLLVLEDVHLAAEQTLAWVSHAGRRATNCLVVVTSRPPAPSLVATRIDLAPLDDAAARSLVGDGPGAEAALARAEGNPLYLLALAGSAADALPASLTDAVRAQAAVLGSAESTLRTAACLGEVLDLDLLASVLQRPTLDVLADLDAAVAAGLLVDRGGALRFHHALVREALDAAAGPARRAFAHRAASRVLAARPGVDPLVVAVHARLGGDATAAHDHYLRAAELAAARFDPSAAAEHLAAALALVPTSAAAHAALARARMASLDLDAAAEAAAVAVDLGGGAAALEVAAWVAYYRRRYDEAVAAADESVARAGDDPAIRGSAIAVAGRVRHGRGDLDGAAAILESATGAPPSVRGVVDVWLAHLRAHQGRPLDTLRLTDRALLDAARLSHPWASLHGRFARVMALGQVGRLAEAVAACDDFDAAVDRSGVVGSRLRGPALNLRSWLLRSAGRCEEALECNEAALDATAAPDRRSPSGEGMAESFWVAHLDAAEALLAAGNADDAAGWVERAAPVESWTGTMAWHQRHRLDLLRARLAVLDGDRDRAAEAAAGVVAGAASRGAGRYQALATAWLALAGGLDAGDDLVAAVDALGRCAALDGWPALLALAERFGRDDWRVEAERRATTLVASAGPLAGSLRTRVAATFG